MSDDAAFERVDRFLRLAIELSTQGLESGRGGPFGALVVRGDEVVGRGSNQVLASGDPTAHAEIVAIRDACRHTGSHQLDGCELYSSCEPCPMCLGAIYWARPDRVWFAATREDAASVGFDDAVIYDEIGKRPQERRIPMTSRLSSEALRAFGIWSSIDDKRLY